MSRPAHAPSDNDNPADNRDGNWEDTAWLAVIGGLVGLVTSREQAAIHAMSNAVAHRAALSAAWDEYDRLNGGADPQATRHTQRPLNDTATSRKGPQS